MFSKSLQICLFVSFPQKRNGIVFSLGVNYLHSWGNIQSELSFVVVNVNTAANFINFRQNSVHRNATFQLLPCTKWRNYRLKLSLSAYYTRKLRTFNTSNRIVIVKRYYIFEVETPPHHAICPPMRYLKSIEAISFVQQSLVQQKNSIGFRFRVIY